MLIDSSVVLDVVEHLLAAPAAGLGDVVGPVVPRAEVGDELAGIAVLGNGLAVLAGEHARAEAPHLAAGVVDVVLAGDLVPRALEEPGERVAVGREPAVADVQRPGRVGRDELDHHPLAVADVGLRVAVDAATRRPRGAPRGATCRGGGS